MKQNQVQSNLDNRDQLRNILETIRAREDNGNKSKEITITEFGG